MGRMVPTGRDLAFHNCGELRLELWGYTDPGWFWAKSAEAAENKGVDLFRGAKGAQSYDKKGVDCSGE